MKVEHSIERKINEELVTQQAVDAFHKFSICANPFDDERSMRCFAVVIKGIELGLLENDVDLKIQKIVDKVIDKVMDIIHNIKTHLESNTEFDEDLYCIDLSEMFDTSDVQMLNWVKQALDEALHKKKLAAEYSSVNNDKFYIYGWHKAEYFDNQYTQEYMNNLCKNIEIILDIEEYIKHPRLNCLGNSELDMRDDKPTNKIEMCLKLFGISFIKRSTMFWWQN